MGTEAAEKKSKEYELGTPSLSHSIPSWHPEPQSPTLSTLSPSHPLLVWPGPYQGNFHIPCPKAGD